MKEPLSARDGFASFGIIGRAVAVAAVAGAALTLCTTSAETPTTTVVTSSPL